MQCFLNDAA